MKHELPENEYERIRPLFKGWRLTLLTDAILARNSPARIWVDDPNRPETAFLWDKADCYYLAGDPKNPDFNADIAAFITSQTAQGFSFFEIHHTVDSWEEAIPMLFAAVSPVRRDRVLQVMRQPGNSDWNKKIPLGSRVQRIDASLLGGEALTIRDAVAHEIRRCWNAIDAFLDRGFGYAVLHEEEIVCWCTAEYVSERKCGIGIETLQQYQGRGLATYAASAFVEHAVSRRITPHWDSWKDNVASLAVARKVGFEKLLEYSVYLGRATQATWPERMSPRASPHGEGLLSRTERERVWEMLRCWA